MSTSGQFDQISQKKEPVQKVLLFLILENGFKGENFDKYKNGDGSLNYSEEKIPSSFIGYVKSGNETAFGKQCNQ